MTRGARAFLILMVLMAGVATSDKRTHGSARQLASPLCFNSFSLPGVMLKDHTLFAFDGYYYLAAIRIELPAPDGRGEYTFAYARTRDLCDWEDLGTVIERGKAGTPDEAYVWAPYVIEEDGVFYMFYTGVNRNGAQSIMLAQSRDPSDPSCWDKQGVVFRPNHPGMIYPGPEHWSDGRDATIIRHEDHYYMYYTGRDTSGGIVGVARANKLVGPWQDLGATLRTSTEVVPESPYVVAYHGHYYLYYNAAGRDNQGPAWHSAESPLGPWGPPTRQLLGWAHDFYFDGSAWYSTYVIGDGKAIGVTPVRWNLDTEPPTPQIALEVFLPHLPTGVNN